MPTLTSMKIDKKKLQAEAAAPVAESALFDRPAYPYGLSLRLDHDALQTLGIEELPAAGAILALVAKVSVEGSRSEDRVGADGKTTQSKSLHLQITDLALSDDGKQAKAASAALYPES